MTIKVLLKFLFLFCVASSLIIIITAGTTNALMQRTSNLTFYNSSLNFFSTSIISPSSVPDANAFAVFATYTQPSRLVKVSLSSPSSSTTLSESSWIANISLNSGEAYVRCSVISQDGATGFFGTETSPAYIIKVNLDVGSSSLTRTSRVTLSNAGESPLWSAVMNPNGADSLWGSWQTPGRIIKIRNSDLVPQGTLTLASGEDKLQSACITPDGSVALFGCWTSAPAGIIVKVQVSTLTRLGALTLNSGENFPSTAVMSPDGSFALFGTDTTDFGRVIKVRVSDLSRIQGLSLTSGQPRLASSVMHISGSHAYFGSASSPGVISKIALSDPSISSPMFLESTLTLETGEDFLWTAEIGQSSTLNSDFAYFASYTQPSSVIQVYTAFTSTTTTTTTSTTTGTTSSTITLEPTQNLTPLVPLTSAPATTTSESATSDSDSSSTSLSAGIIAAIVIGSLVAAILLLLIFVPMCLGQPGWLCAWNNNLKYGAVCADGKHDAVVPDDEPHFNHPHIQQKMKEMAFIEEQIAKRGGTYFHPGGGGDESVFQIGSPHSPSNSLSPAMRRKLASMEKDEAVMRNLYYSRDQDGSGRRTSLTPMKRDVQKGKYHQQNNDTDQEYDENYETRGGRDHQAEQKNETDLMTPHSKARLSVSFPFEDQHQPQQQQQQQEMVRSSPYRQPSSAFDSDPSGTRVSVSPTSWTRGADVRTSVSPSSSPTRRNTTNTALNNNTGGGATSSPYRTDKNTQYYYYSSTTPPRRNVLSHPAEANDPNLLPLPEAHRAQATPRGGEHDLDHMTLNAWSTPSGRTYGNVRSPVKNNSNSSYHNNNNATMSTPHHQNRNGNNHYHSPPLNAVAANRRQHEHSFYDEHDQNSLPHHHYYSPSPQNARDAYARQQQHQSPSNVPDYSIHNHVSGDRQRNQLVNHNNNGDYSYRQHHSPSAFNSRNSNRMYQHEQEEEDVDPHYNYYDSQQRTRRRPSPPTNGGRPTNIFSDEEEDHDNDNDTAMSDLSQTQSPESKNRGRNNYRNNNDDDMIHHQHHQQRRDSNSSIVSSEDVTINRFSPAKFYQRQQEELSRRGGSPERKTQSWR